MRPLLYNSPKRRGGGSGIDSRGVSDNIRHVLHTFRPNERLGERSLGISTTQAAASLLLEEGSAAPDYNETAATATADISSFSETDETPGFEEEKRGGDGGGKEIGAAMEEGGFRRLSRGIFRRSQKPSQNPQEVSRKPQELSRKDTNGFWKRGDDSSTAAAAAAAALAVERQGEEKSQSPRWRGGGVGPDREGGGREEEGGAGGGFRVAENWKARWIYRNSRAPAFEADELQVEVRHKKKLKGKKAV